jgi:hypothetical protein
MNVADPLGKMLDDVAFYVRGLPSETERRDAAKFVLGAARGIAEAIGGVADEPPATSSATIPANGPDALPGSALKAAQVVRDKLGELRTEIEPYTRDHQVAAKLARRVLQSVKLAEGLAVVVVHLAANAE